MSNFNSNKALIDHLCYKGIIQTSLVETVMRTIDRGHYSSNTNVYNDTPQGIGYAVTISAPHMHAQCLELLSKKLTRDSRVLDVGSGSGYLVACFALMLEKLGGGKCYGIEHIQELVETSKKILKRIMRIFLRIVIFESETVSLVYQKKLLSKQYTWVQQHLMFLSH